MSRPLQMGTVLVVLPVSVGEDPGSSGPGQAIVLEPGPLIRARQAESRTVPVCTR
jgi:hypothetical protein